MPDGSLAVKVDEISIWPPSTLGSSAFPPLIFTFEIVVVPADSSPAVAGPATARRTVRRSVPPCSLPAVTRSDANAAPAGMSPVASTPPSPEVVNGSSVQVAPSSRDHSTLSTVVRAELPRVDDSMVSGTGPAGARLRWSSPEADTPRSISGTSVDPGLHCDANVHSLRIFVDSWDHGTLRVIV
jgi:hypothetical protein